MVAHQVRNARDEIGTGGSKLPTPYPQSHVKTLPAAPILGLQPIRKQYNQAQKM